MKKGNRIFYVVYVEPSPLRDCLEAIRVLSNPRVKDLAHITVRGPYRKPVSIDSVNRKLVGNRAVLDRAGNYFKDGQNTVFFGCTSPKLREVWRKPDYSFDPHVTIYDGDSLSFAKELYQTLSKYSYRIEFSADMLEPLRSIRGQTSFVPHLVLNNDTLSRLANIQLEPRLGSKIPTHERLNAIDRICAQLSRLRTEQDSISTKSGIPTHRSLSAPGLP